MGTDYSIPKIDRLIEGLTIIKKYEPNSDFSAAHDEFYAGGEKYDEYSEEDKQRLEVLGFMYDKSLPSFMVFI